MGRLLLQPYKSVFSETILLNKRGYPSVQEYLDIVAKSYDKAPLYEAKESGRWKRLIIHIEKMFGRIFVGSDNIKGKIQVIFVRGQPYNSYYEIEDDINQNNRLLVSEDFNIHPVFTPEQNLVFRAVHDKLAHYDRHNDFSFRGELKAYNAHIKLSPVETYPALFTEIIGQAAFYLVYGHFGEQKIALLREFDYEKIGVMDSTIIRLSNL